MSNVQRHLMQSAALRRHALFRVCRLDRRLVTGDKPPVRDPKPRPESDPAGQPHRDPLPPDAIPDPMPGIDPQQTPGTDRPPLPGMSTTQWRSDTRSLRLS